MLTYSRNSYHRAAPRDARPKRAGLYVRRCVQRCADACQPESLLDLQLAFEKCCADAPLRYLERAIDSFYAGCRPAALQKRGTLKRMVEGNVERSSTPAPLPSGKHQRMVGGDEDVPDVEWVNSVGAQEEDDGADDERRCVQCCAVRAFWACCLLSRSAALTRLCGTSSAPGGGEPQAHGRGERGAQHYPRAASEWQAPVDGRW